VCVSHRQDSTDAELMKEAKFLVDMSTERNISLSRLNIQHF